MIAMLNTLSSTIAKSLHQHNLALRGKFTGFDHAQIIAAHKVLIHPFQIANPVKMKCLYRHVD